MENEDVACKAPRDHLMVLPRGMFEEQLHAFIALWLATHAWGYEPIDTLDCFDHPMLFNHYDGNMGPINH